MPSTFAVFATRRALDQVAISICYPGLNVKIPGSYVGRQPRRRLAHRVEDLAVCGALPDISVADPVDNGELRASCAAPRTPPVRSTSGSQARGPDSSGRRTFEWGHGRIVRAGYDVTLFGTGLMTTMSLGQPTCSLPTGSTRRSCTSPRSSRSTRTASRDRVADRLRRDGRVRLHHRRLRSGSRRDARRTLAGPDRRIGVRDRWVDSGGIGELFEAHKMRPIDIAAAAHRAIALCQQIRLSPEVTSRPPSDGVRSTGEGPPWPS